MKVVEMLKTVTRVLVTADCRPKTEDRRLELNKGWYWSESVVSNTSVVNRWRWHNCWERHDGQRQGSILIVADDRTIQY
jgi:hypothetical protein